MTVRILLPGPLREHVGGEDATVEGDTVLDALRDAARRFPRLRRHVFDDAGALRAYVNVYLNDEDVRGLDAGIDTRLGPADTITIVPSIAGGDPTEPDAEHRHGGSHTGPAEAAPRNRGADPAH